jgi:hypothetical protein
VRVIFPTGLRCVFHWFSKGRVNTTLKSFSNIESRSGLLLSGVVIPVSSEFQVSSILSSTAVLLISSELFGVTSPRSIHFLSYLLAVKSI